MTQSYPKPLIDAVDALDALLVATAPHGILSQLGDEWGRGVKALAAARALIGPKFGLGAWVLSIKGDSNREDGETRETGPNAIGQIEHIDVTGGHHIYFRDSDIWVAHELHELRDPALYRLLTDPYEIEARRQGWQLVDTEDEKRGLVMSREGHEHSYLSWQGVCFGEKYTVKP